MRAFLESTTRILALASLALLACGASAQSPSRSGAASYPIRPVQIIVPFTPGTGMDILARIVGQKLSERWGQPVIVDNRPGASGNIGTDLVVKAAPDGYTLLLTANTLVMTVSLYSNVPVRSDQGPGAHREDGGGNHGDHAEPWRPCALAEGIRRLREGQPGEARLRLAWRRNAAAPRHGAAQIDRPASTCSTFRTKGRPERLPGS